MQNLSNLYRRHAKTIIIVFSLTLLFVLSIAPASAQSLDLNIDVQPLFDGIETFLPVAIAVFGLIGGVAIAFMLAKYIVNSFLNAFSGNSI